MPVNNVTMKHINIGGKRGVRISEAKNIKIDDLWISNDLESAVSISNCDSISINNLNIVKTDKEKTPIVYTNVTNSSLTNFNILPEKLIEISGNSKNIQLDKQIPENRIKVEIIDVD